MALRLATFALCGLLIASAAAVAKTTSDPAALVRELYRLHRNEQGPFFQTRSKALVERFFEQRPADGIWKEATRTGEGSGLLDFDPLYNAQDFDIRNLNVGSAKVTGNDARVIVTFDNYTQKERIEFRLRRTRVGWRIRNVVYSENFDLLTLLTDGR